MPRVRIIAPTFLAFGRAPTEKRPNSDKQSFVDVPLPHGRLYEAGEVVELPDKHPDGKPFVVCDAAYCERVAAEQGHLIEPTMELLDDEPVTKAAPGRR